MIGRIQGTVVDKDYNNLKINIKRGSSINLNIHDSKVFCSGLKVYKGCYFSLLFQGGYFQIEILKNSSAERGL